MAETVNRLVGAEFRRILINVVTDMASTAAASDLFWEFMIQTQPVAEVQKMQQFQASLVQHLYGDTYRKWLVENILSH